MNLLRLASEYLVTKAYAVRRAFVGLPYEPGNVSSSATVQTVQAAIRAAENGDTRQLFALYRDLTVGGSHIQCEFGKRKMAVLSQPHSILPQDKENKDDVAAALAVAQMISDCENWSDGMAHLLDATMWPVSVVEKLYRPAGEAMPGKPSLRFTLRRMHVVNPTLFCFRKSYEAKKPNQVTTVLAPEDAEAWESEIRFHNTDAEGRVENNWDAAYPAEADRHIIHRGHLLSGVRDNWGGPMRSIVFWWLLSVLGRDWFARGMERYGSPFPLAKTDATDDAKMTFLREALSLSTKVGGLVVDNDTQVELIEAMTTGMADAHEKFINICNREISKAIIGQELSATATSTGMGSGTANLQGDVREDIRAFDQNKLAETLNRQLFDHFLRINGMPGRVKIVWGGLDSTEAKEVSDLLVSLSTAGLEPTDEAIPLLSERVGFQLQRKAPPEPQAMPGAGGGFGNGGRPVPHFAKGWPDLNGVSFGGLRTFAATGLAAGLGVPVSWLAPLRKHLAEIERKAEDRSMTDADLLTFLQAANDRLPELFSEMDVVALADVFEAGMGAAVIDGVRDGLKRQAKALPPGSTDTRPAGLSASGQPITLNVEVNPAPDKPKTSTELTPVYDDQGRITRYLIKELPASNPETLSETPEDTGGASSDVEYSENRVQPSAKLGEGHP